MFMCCMESVCQGGCVIAVCNVCTVWLVCHVVCLCGSVRVSDDCMVSVCVHAFFFLCVCVCT